VTRACAASRRSFCRHGSERACDDIALLERAASALDDLLEEVVFLGGATVGLWITDPAAPEPRPTKDVDVIVEVTSRGRFAEFEERLRAHGFEKITRAASSAAGATATS
jgi:hypothetical protein